jgi:hypothetical protein
MSDEKAPELHTKTLLTSIADIGKAAAAIDEAAGKLAAAPLTPAPPALNNGAGLPSK